MKDNIRGICPYCGCNKNEKIDISTSCEFSSIILRGNGSADLRVCLRCGVVFIPYNKIKRILKGNSNGMF